MSLIFKGERGGLVVNASDSGSRGREFAPHSGVYTCHLFLKGSAVAWWLMPRTPDPEVGGSSPVRVNPCCVLEQGTFTPQKVLVIPRKRWLRPNMTEKLFTGTLRINQPTKLIFKAKMAVLCRYDKMSSC